jgi:hypothetical protein
MKKSRGGCYDACHPVLVDSAMILNAERQQRVKPASRLQEMHLHHEGCCFGKEANRWVRLLERVCKEQVLRQKKQVQIQDTRANLARQKHHVDGGEWRDGSKRC